MVPGPCEKEATPIIRWFKRRMEQGMIVTDDTEAPGQRTVDEHINSNLSSSWCCSFFTVSLSHAPNERMHPTAEHLTNQDSEMLMVILMITCPC